MLAADEGVVGFATVNLDIDGSKVPASDDPVKLALPTDVPNVRAIIVQVSGSIDVVVAIARGPSADASNFYGGVAMKASASPAPQRFEMRPGDDPHAVLHYSAGSGFAIVTVHLIGKVR